MPPATCNAAISLFTIAAAMVERLVQLDGELPVKRLFDRRKCAGQSGKISGATPDPAQFTPTATFTLPPPTPTGTPVPPTQTPTEEPTAIPPPPIDTPVPVPPPATPLPEDPPEPAKPAPEKGVNEIKKSVPLVQGRFFM